MALGYGRTTREPLSGRALSAGEREVNRDLSLNLDRFAVQIVRAIAPLLDSFEGSLNQQWMAAKNLKIFDLAFAIDYSMQQHGSLNSSLLGKWRIFRLYSLNETALHAVRDARWVVRGGRASRSKRRARAGTEACPKRIAGVVRSPVTFGPVAAQKVGRRGRISGSKIEILPGDMPRS